MKLGFKSRFEMMTDMDVLLLLNSHGLLQKEGRIWQQILHIIAIMIMIRKLLNLSHFGFAKLNPIEVREVSKNTWRRWCNRGHCYRISSSDDLSIGNLLKFTAARVAFTIMVPSGVLSKTISNNCGDNTSCWSKICSRSGQPALRLLLSLRLL